MYTESTALLTALDLTGLVWTGSGGSGTPSDEGESLGLGGVRGGGRVGGRLEGLGGWGWEEGWRGGGMVGCSHH